MGTIITVDKMSGESNSALMNFLSIEIPKFPKDEIGDRILCIITNIPYEYFLNNLNTKEKLELSEKYLEETLNVIIHLKYKSLNVFPHFLIDRYVGKINIQHLKECDCYQEIINRYVDLESRRNLLNENNINQKDDPKKISDDARIKALKFINNSDITLPLCPYMYRELLNTIEIFGKDYDLTRAKIQQVVKSILIYQMSLLESQNHCNNNDGMFEKMYNKFGDSRQVISQAELYKIKMSDKILDATKMLDEMVEGSKVSIAMNVNHIPLNALMDKMKQNMIDSTFVEKKEGE